MNPCYDLSMENFSSIYLDNHYLSDTQEPMRAGITHVLKVGFYFGICYSVHRMNKICKGKGVIEIKDSDLPDFIKEYKAYTKKHTKKG